MYKKFFAPAVVLTVICLIITGLLAATNALTEKKIKENVENESALARKEVFAQASGINKKLEVLGANSDIEIYAAEDDSGSLMGYVIKSGSKGYGGKVNVMTGIDKSLTITGIKVLSDNNETPGLGKKAEDPKELTDKMKGKLPEGEKFIVKNNVDAITSATITSNAVIEAVNIAVNEAKLQLRGGQ